MDITKVIEQLRTLAGTANVLCGEDIGADFTRDEYPGDSFTPDAVVKADSAETAAAVAKLCFEQGIALTARGAGTGQVGGCVPVKGGIVLSLKEMNKIVAVDAENKRITVEPGVLLQDVKAAADSRGLYYPPDPGEQTATIGGNAATDAAGPYAVKYGRTGDYVLELEIVTADGRIERRAGQEACAAIIGSEGALAIITQLTLKLVDKPGADAILLFPFMDAETAVRAAQRILAGDYDVAALEYMDTDIVDFSGKVAGSSVFPVEMDGEYTAGTLMLVLEGADDDAVMEQMESIAELAEELECLDILVIDTPSMKRDAWAAHTAFHTSMESGARSAWEVNVELAAEHMAEMIEYAKAKGEEKGFKVMLYAHVGSGGMHIHAASEQSRREAAPAAAELVDALYKKTVELGGSAAGEYGVGYAKTAYVDSDTKAAFAALKAAMDARGILNPGKVVC